MLIKAPDMNIKIPDTHIMPPEKLIMPPDMNNMASEKFKMLPMMIMMTQFFVIFKSDLGIIELKWFIESVILWKSPSKKGKIVSIFPNPTTGIIHINTSN